MADYAAYEARYRVVPEQAEALDGLLIHYVRDFLAVERKSVELLREQGVDQLHSRKLRSFAEVAFQ